MLKVSSPASVLEMRVLLSVDDEPATLLAIHPDLKHAALDPFHWGVKVLPVLVRIEARFPG